MALLELIEEKVVRVPLVAASKPEVIAELVDVLDAAGLVKDRAGAIEAAMEREALGSTGLEEGIAVPHGKTRAVDDLVLAIGVSPGGIDYGAMDGKPSRLFFLLLAPPDKAGPHLQALAEIARMVRSASFCRALQSSRTPAEVVSLFKEG